MIPWWREKPLSSEEVQLLSLLYAAHTQSSFRDNASSVAVATSAQAQCSYTQAVTAGLSMLGGLHAPVQKVCEFLLNPNVDERLEKGEKIPGWGNGFMSGADPDWALVDSHIKNHWPEIYRTITETSAKLPVSPNPGCYTAATAIILGIPSHCAVYLFLWSRLDAWSKLFLDHS
jgi:citrate synthase